MFFYDKEEKEEYMKNHILVGKTITNLEVEKDGYSLTVEVEGTNNPIVAECYAECCSNTWIENVELPALGFPAKVLSVEDLDLPVPDYGDKYEYLQVYGFKINTDRGEIVIDFRNESNGYYGGSLDWPKAVNAA
jgi:hypothetical protein